MQVNAGRRRRRVILGAAGVALACCACGRTSLPDLPDASAYDNEWVVGLTGDPVTSPDDFAPGAASTADGVLSLRQALILSWRSPGTDHIAFDPIAFPSADPAVIALTAELPPIRDRGTWLDAQGAGVILDGSAYGGSLIEVRGDGAMIRGFTLRGFGNATITIVDAAGVQIVGNNFEQPGTAAIEASNLWYGRIADNVVEAAGADAIVATDLHGSEISRNSVVAAAGIGLFVKGAEDVIIDGNTVDRVSGTDYIMVTDGRAVTIDNNSVIIGNKLGQRGIRLERIDDSLIVDNLIDPGSAFYIDLLDSNDNDIVGNLLDGSDSGIVFEGTSARNFVFRNIVIGVVYHAVYLFDEVVGLEVVHNTFFNCPDGIIGNGEVIKDLNNLKVADASFVDPQNYDFRLVADSPHIDAGEPTGLDLVPGDAKLYLGAAPDLGAVESY